jgi:hypothetical protein
MCRASQEVWKATGHGLARLDLDEASGTLAAVLPDIRRDAGCQLNRPVAAGVEQRAKRRYVHHPRERDATYWTPACRYVIDITGAFSVARKFHRRWKRPDCVYFVDRVITRDHSRNDPSGFGSCRRAAARQASRTRVQPPGVIPVWIRYLCRAGRHSIEILRDCARMGGQSPRGARRGDGSRLGNADRRIPASWGWVAPWVRSLTS